MKRLVAIIFSVLLSLGLAGQVIASFELGNVQLVAYSNTTGAFPIPGSGIESHYDLGPNIDSFMDLSIGSFTVDTHIDLVDLVATDWSQVYVGIFGGGLYPNYKVGPMNKLYSYREVMQLSGNNPSYATLLSTNPELQLGDGFFSMDMYGYDLDGNLTKIGTWELDTTGGSLVVKYNVASKPESVKALPWIPLLLLDD
jgi:hypothetical protein